jgi:hypothetical protein
MIDNGIMRKEDSSTIVEIGDYLKEDPTRLKKKLKLTDPAHVDTVIVADSSQLNFEF